MKIRIKLDEGKWFWIGLGGLITWILIGFTMPIFWLFAPLWLLNIFNFSIEE